ncbi:MAG TPA: OB-fold nucleic acid binding domain-containing protein [candidate division Zixibacteria bacterium]|nr:OB-fold nucleic acid binding domain-containing protein [candidate division Zixibacteria bacterium]
MGQQKCSICQGTGKEIISDKTCPDCKGMGSTKIVLSSYSSNTDAGKCKTCHGTGSLIKSKQCENCNGTGILRVCDSCGKPITNPSPEKHTVEICSECKNSPIVFTLKPPCSSRSVKVGTYYRAKVKEFKDFGVFAELFPGVQGLIRTKNLKGIQRSDKGKEIIVFIEAKNREGKIELVPVTLKEYRHGVKRDSMDRFKISSISRKMENKTVLIQGKVSQIRKTSGPISYNFTDESGSIAGAAFIKPTEDNPYINIEVGDIVEVVGTVNTHRDMLQIEIQDMIEAGDEETKVILERIEKVLEEKSKPTDISFLIKDQVLEKMKPDLYNLAKKIRRSIFDGTPILLRHHADTDGITCAVALEQAIIPLIMEEMSETIAFRIKRSPSKSPFWDFIDVTKDVDFALQDAIKFGDKLPYVLLLDLGSSHESLASINFAKHFGINVSVLDHHFPDKIIQKNVEIHANPYYYDGDYNLCSGMLGVELARIVNPNISDKIDYIAAIAGLTDRVQGKALEQYLSRAKKKGLSEDFLRKIGLAIDYQQYFLRFSDGKNIIDSLFGFENLNSKAHQEFVEFLANEAQTAIDQQLEICLAHLKEEILPNDIILVSIDVEKFARRFEFPSPGKSTGAVHDKICQQNPEKAVITLGLGPDFVVLRSKGAIINFPKIITNLKKKMPQAGADGGGHEVVGTVKFVEGMQLEVLDFLKKTFSKVETIDDD